MAVNSQHRRSLLAFFTVVVLSILLFGQMLRSDAAGIGPAPAVSDPKQVSSRVFVDSVPNRMFADQASDHRGKRSVVSQP